MEHQMGVRFRRLHCVAPETRLERHPRARACARLPAHTAAGDSARAQIFQFSRSGCDRRCGTRRPGHRADDWEHPGRLAGSRAGRTPEQQDALDGSAAAPRRVRAAGTLCGAHVVLAYTEPCRCNAVAPGIELRICSSPGCKRHPGAAAVAGLSAGARASRALVGCVRGLRSCVCHDAGFGEDETDHNAAPKRARRCGACARPKPEQFDGLVRSRQRTFRTKALQRSDRLLRQGHCACAQR